MAIDSLKVGADIIQLGYDDGRIINYPREDVNMAFLSGDKATLNNQHLDFDTLGFASFQALKDYLTVTDQRVAPGLLTGATITTTPVEVWALGGTRTLPAIGGGGVVAVTGSGAGDTGVVEVRGLIKSTLVEDTENVTLTGAVAANTVKEFDRVNKITAVSGTVAGAGNVTAAIGGNNQAVIGQFQTESRMTQLTVPAGKVAKVTNLQSWSAGGAGTELTLILLEYRPEGSTVWQAAGGGISFVGGINYATFKRTFPEKTELRCTAVNVNTTTTTTAQATYWFELFDAIN